MGTQIEYEKARDKRRNIAHAMAQIIHEAELRGEEFSCREEARYNELELALTKAKQEEDRLARSRGFGPVGGGEPINPIDLLEWDGPPAAQKVVLSQGDSFARWVNAHYGGDSGRFDYREATFGPVLSKLLEWQA